MPLSRAVVIENMSGFTGCGKLGFVSGHDFRGCGKTRFV
jgi:hypothetical protein